MDLTSQSKFLSLLLRHDPSRLNLTMDSKGWVNVQELIDNSKGNKTEFTLEIIEAIVASDTKQRYAFSENHLQIRANQGHSLQVDVELTRKAPPKYLYHGTSFNNLGVIKKEGLNKMSRQYVHLSIDADLAKKVGSRHGRPVVLRVNTGDMQKNGFEFFLSKNEIWLTDCVPAEYLEEILVPSSSG